MLIGARFNWLLSHGKGKTWGDGQAWGGEIHPDRHLAQGDGQQRRIAAPVVGDIGSCVSAMLDGMG